MSSVKKWLLVGGAVVALCAVAGAVGGAITVDSGKRTAEMAYADFIVIMLTGVAVMVTVLAVIIAVAAFIGWQSFDQRVRIEVAKSIKDGFQPNGPLHKIFAEEKNKANVEGVEAIDSSFEDEAREEAKGEGEY